jgi:transcription antitermination factor NusG
MTDGVPAQLGDHIVDEIRSREVDGAVELPRRDGLKAGDQVRVLAGPLQGLYGLYQEQRPHERVLVLLGMLGSQRRVELPKDSIEAAS